MASRLNWYLTIFLLALGYLSTVSGSYKVTSINFVVEPAVYQPGAAFALLCTVEVHPKSSRFGVAFLHNGTIIGKYLMHDGSMTRWISRSPSIRQGSAIYPTFTASIAERTWNASGEYKCQVGHSEGELHNWVNYQAESNTWNSNGSFGYFSGQNTFFFTLTSLLASMGARLLF